MHLSLSGRDHSWHRSLQRPCLLYQGTLRDSPTHFSYNLLQLADLTVLLNQILPQKGKKQYHTKKLPEMPLILTKKVQIVPQSQVLLECSLAKLSDQYQSCTGLVFPSDRLEDKCSFSYFITQQN